ncbi:hypothetical protein [Micromonospora sp. ATA51]|uniref:hypothetical protein n=1 Tax=Micromonospora sp. ATA51 TaxID=2806098 RepID=UPI001A55D304|nr:hypothetical protein [Micromonospora sp. ATA51]MBM0224410.1 hypothetical protein [Micromonospora sp. ATA51]
MSLNDADPVLVAVRLVVAVISLGLLVFGVRVAVTRQLPRKQIHFGRSTAEQRPQPVRIGGGVALAGASLLIQQVASLISIPSALELALLGVALVLFVTAVGWFALRRD